MESWAVSLIQATGRVVTVIPGRVKKVGMHPELEDVVVVESDLTAQTGPGVYVGAMTKAITRLSVLREKYSHIENARNKISELQGWTHNDWSYTQFVVGPGVNGEYRIISYNPVHIKNPREATPFGSDPWK